MSTIPAPRLPVKPTAASARGPLLSPTLEEAFPQHPARCSSCGRLLPTAALMLQPWGQRECRNAAACAQHVLANVLPIAAEAPTLPAA